MGVVKLLAFVLILFGINAVNANNKFPNNHKMDLGTFVSAVRIFHFVLVNIKS